MDFPVTAGNVGKGYRFTKLVEQISKKPSKYFGGFLFSRFAEQLS